jgi:hypothetical protein
MGRRHREAVAEMRQREGLPTYAQTRPDMTTRREWLRGREDVARAIERQGRLMLARAGDPGARACLARTAEVVRWSSWACMRGIQPPRMRGIPIVAFGEPVLGLGRWALGSEVPKPVSLDREPAPAEPAHGGGGGAGGVPLAEPRLDDGGAERDVVPDSPEKV